MNAPIRMSARSHLKHVFDEQMRGSLRSSTAVEPGPAAPSWSARSAQKGESAQYVSSIGTHARSTVHRSVTSTKCSAGLFSAQASNDWRTIWWRRSHDVQLIGGMIGLRRRRRWRWARRGRREREALRRCEGRRPRLRVCECGRGSGGGVRTPAHHMSLIQPSSSMMWPLIDLQKSGEIA